MEGDNGAVLAAHVAAAEGVRAEQAPVLPEDLARVADLGGDLHTHTDLTDGIVSLAGMIAAAQACGYEYYAVTDHAPNLVMQRMTDEKMLAQRERLRALAGTTGWSCCTAASSTSRPTAAWTGTRTSSPRCLPEQQSR